MTEAAAKIRVSRVFIYRNRLRGVEENRRGEPDLLEQLDDLNLEPS
jgi:hypothetical protein